jgi:transcriptional regulator with XRE-family HTH domain
MPSNVLSVQKVIAMIDTTEHFAKKLQSLMDSKGVGVTALSRELSEILYPDDNGISPQPSEGTIRKWLKGKTMPRADSLDAISQFFNVAVVDLLGHSKQTKEESELIASEVTGLSIEAIRNIPKLQHPEMLDALLTDKDFPFVFDSIYDYCTNDEVVEHHNIHPDKPGDPMNLPDDITISKEPHAIVNYINGLQKEKVWIEYVIAKVISNIAEKYSSTIGISYEAISGEPKRRESK